MRTDRSLLVLFTMAAACSSSGGRGSPGSDASAPPATCMTAMDCVPYRCVCQDGSTALTATTCVSGSCGDNPSNECPSLCQGHGGVTSSGPEPNVASSPECSAYCAKGASLGCSNPTPCDKYFSCAIDHGGCEVSERAFLDCVVKMGMWSCNSAGGWGVESSCPSFHEMCGGDAGGD
jgi:hypothetical protein